MALRQNKTLSAVYFAMNPAIAGETETTKNIEYKNCYIIINKICGNKDSINIEVQIKNQDTLKTIDTLQYNFIPSIADDSTNFIKQGYVYLKTLDEFKDAVDC